MPSSRPIVRQTLPTFHTTAGPGVSITVLEIRPDGTVRKISKTLMRIRPDHADPKWGTPQRIHDFYQENMPDLRPNLGGLEGWNQRQVVPINIVNEQEGHRIDRFLVFFSNRQLGQAHILPQELTNTAHHYPVFGNIYVASVNANSLHDKTPGAKYIPTLFQNIPAGLEGTSKRDIHRRFVMRAAEAYFKNSEGVVRPWESLP